jgi:hypothetical protein
MPAKEGAHMPAEEEAHMTAEEGAHMPADDRSRLQSWFAAGFLLLPTLLLACGRDGPEEALTEEGQGAP